jgi:exopolysaccharide biosynthesis polyprenyl glycosylphosphotransferase
MYSAKRQFLVACLKIFDIAMMLIALAMSLWIRELFDGQILSLWDLLQMKIKLENFIALLVFVPIYHVVLLSTRLYDSRRLLAGQGEWKDICKAVLVGTILLLTIAVIFQRGNVNKEVVLLFGVLSCVLTCLGRYIIRVILEEVRSRNRNLRNLLLVGWNKRAYDFAIRVLEKPQLGYRIVGFIDDPSNEDSFRRFDLYLEYLGTLQDLNDVIERMEVDEVVISLPIRSFYVQINQLMESCETQGIEVHLLSNFFEMRIAQAQVADFDGTPVISLKTGPSSVGQSYVKRGFDLIVASVLVIVLSSVFLVSAILIKLLSPGGPVFFTQTRVGYNRRHFKMIKFRTMIPNAECLQQDLEERNEAQGPVFKIKDDPRITPIGHLLRKTSIDELPQLFNVIKGDMSLVGPRPLPLRDVARFEESYLKRRFSVKPGITCLWQISGRSNTSFDTWIKQDLDYIDHWSFSLDLKILAKTIPAVFRGAGAY